MLIHEVCKRTKLTKKAIEYYILQGLITPSVLSNGYRDYSEQDVEILNQVKVLRKLDMSTGQIKAILKDTTGCILQAESVRMELEIRHTEKKQAILQKLSAEKSFLEAAVELESIEQGKTIGEKLLDAFPGYFGRFVCMHFSRFLNEPILTQKQQAAYETILAFLDDVPIMKLPQDLEDYLLEGTRHFGVQEMTHLLESTRTSIENPDAFLRDSRETLQEYLAYRQSSEFQNSPAHRLLEFMKEYSVLSGYNDVFLPAMKELSSSYASYVQLLETANEKLLERYPQIAQS